MSLESKPPVEPLSRSAWERVEAGLFERLDRGEHSSVPTPVVAPRVRMQMRAAVMTLAAAAAFLLWWSFKPAATSTAEANVRADERTEVARISSAGNRTETTRIVTMGDATRTTIGDATLILAAASDVRVSGSDADGWLVRLEAGQVDCEVAPRQGRPAFVVRAGETQVTVVGTRFTVAREGLGARVSVSEGHVRVSSGATEVSLGPGEAWPKIPLVTLPRDESSLDRPVTVRPGKHVKSAANKKIRTPQRALDAAQEFEKAARLEVEDPRKAVAIYRSLASGKGPWAPNALYAQARLELELGHRKTARALLQRYLERYPDGLNAADVRSLLQRSSNPE